MIATLWAKEDIAGLLGVDLDKPQAKTKSERTGDQADFEAEPVPDPLPPWVTSALNNPDAGDRSLAHARVVGSCLDSGLTLGQTLTVCESYAPSVEKYGDRLADEVERVWTKFSEDRQDRSENEAPADPAGDDGRVLQFQTFDELAAEVDAAPPRRWLIRNIWPEGDYGMLSAPPKAQKTWCSLDLAVSVATGTPWLGYKPVDVTGPVLVFLGEGGKGNAVRRIRAIADSKKIPSAGLQIVVCARAPHLTVMQHLNEVEDKVEAIKPALVQIDPLYLAARGANLADLYAMGEVLENIQRVCQRHNAALMLVHHFNRNSNVTGAARNSGAGPQEWARVLLSVDVVSRKAGQLPGETVVVTKLEVQGGEVPDQALSITRRVWSDDPDDLGSAMHIATSVTDDEDETVESGQGGGVKLGPGEVKLLEALNKAERPHTVANLIDVFARLHGHGLHDKTVKKYLNRFLELRWVGNEPFSLGGQDAKKWFITEAGAEVHNRRSEHGASMERMINGEDQDNPEPKTPGQSMERDGTFHGTSHPGGGHGAWSAPFIEKGAPDAPPSGAADESAGGARFVPEPDPSCTRCRQPTPAPIAGRCRRCAYPNGLPEEEAS